MTGTPTDPDDANHTTLYDPTPPTPPETPGSSTGDAGPAGDACSSTGDLGPAAGDLGPTARRTRHRRTAARRALPDHAAVGVHVALP